MATRLIEYTPENSVKEFTPFAVDVSYPEGLKHSYQFTDADYEENKRAISESPEDTLTTFMIGALTSRLKPRLGRLSPGYALFIMRIHMFYTRLGLSGETMKVRPLSSFVREAMGQRKISSPHASNLDESYLQISDFLTLFPGASNSSGTKKELIYATERGKEIVILSRRRAPETDFHQGIVDLATKGPGSRLTVIEFGSYPELFTDLRGFVEDISSRRGFNNREQQIPFMTK